MKEVSNAKLRAWMAANGVTQDKLAKGIGLPSYTVKARIRGVSEWRTPEIRAILEFTKCDFWEIF